MKRKTFEKSDFATAETVEPVVLVNRQEGIFLEKAKTARTLSPRIPFLQI